MSDDGRDYEFGALEDAAFADAARWMMLLGVIDCVSGAFALANKSWVAGCLSLVVGALLIAARGGFRRIVTTEGSDVSNLLGALRNLRLMLIVRTVVTIVATGLAVVTLIDAFGKIKHLPH